MITASFHVLAAAVQKEMKLHPELDAQTQERRSIPEPRADVFPRQKRGKERREEEKYTTSSFANYFIRFERILARTPLSIK